MTTHTLTAEIFDTTLDSHPIVFIDWWAEWCGPCKAFAPAYEALSEAHPTIHFTKIDTDAQTTLAQEYGIRSIPTLMAFREGILVFSQAGLMPPAALEDLVAKVSGLDMDEVRKSIEEQEKNAPSPEEFENED